MKFSQRVLDLVKQIPRGKVTTYSAIARALNTKYPPREREHIHRVSGDSLFTQGKHSLLTQRAKYPPHERGSLLTQRASARAVGQALKRNQDPDKIPCYRVIKSSGEVGGYSLGVREKIRRLRADGVEVKGGKVSEEFIISHL